MMTNLKAISADSYIDLPAAAKEIEQLLNSELYSQLFCERALEQTFGRRMLARPTCANWYVGVRNVSEQTRIAHAVHAALACRCVHRQEHHEQRCVPHFDKHLSLLVQLTQESVAWAKHIPALDK